jgi:hypothetical protein
MLTSRREFCALPSSEVDDKWARIFSRFRGVKAFAAGFSLIATTIIPAVARARPGKNMGSTNWTYGS